MTVTPQKAHALQSGEGISWGDRGPSIAVTSSAIMEAKIITSTMGGRKKERHSYFPFKALPWGCLMSVLSQLGHMYVM